MKHVLIGCDTRGKDQHSDLVKAEVEKGFGLLTLELEVSYQRDVSTDVVSEGVEVSIWARAIPFINCLRHGSVDTTFGVGLEAGIPVNSSVSKNAELVPKIFDDLKLGDHFTLQSSLVIRHYLAAAPIARCRRSNTDSFSDIRFQHDELPLPGCCSSYPSLSCKGESAINRMMPGVRL